MLFNSFQFLIFFFIVTAAYFAFPHRWRWQLLVIASCYFYMALVPTYILILFFLIIIDYSAGLLIDRTRGTKRRLILIFSLAANIGMLVIFKYFNFFNSNLSAVISFLGWHYNISNLHLILPIGLSFHTFQSMSYTIEVYRGNYPVEKHLGVYALYVLFYPQMVAGPIERPGNLLRQLHEEKLFDYQRVADGLKLMVWGLFKKVVIADRLAMLVNHVYNDPKSYDGIPLILATYFFAFQIYCDFSGYTDIAIGAAKVMGMQLMKNFDQPYYAKSIGEFWRRWHISLSSWFRDYLFLPISFSVSRLMKTDKVLFIKSDVLTYSIATAITMIIAGLWHGANWSFIIWGMLFGLYLVSSVLTRGIRKYIVNFLRLNKIPRVHSYIKIFITFHLVTFSWIFFRAKSLPEAWYVVTNIFHFSLSQSIWELGLDKSEMLIAILSIIILEIVHYLQRGKSIIIRLSEKPVVARWAFYFTAVFVILLFGKFISLDFIYFQF